MDSITDRIWNIIPSWALTGEGLIEGVSWIIEKVTQHQGLNCSLHYYNTFKYLVDLIKLWFLRIFGTEIFCHPIFWFFTTFGNLFGTVGFLGRLLESFSGPSHRPFIFFKFSAYEFSSSLQKSIVSLDIPLSRDCTRNSSYSISSYYLLFSFGFEAVVSRSWDIEWNEVSEFLVLYSLCYKFSMRSFFFFIISLQITKR